MNWDFIYRGETKDLDASARAQAPGSFIELPDGCTHYELAGPEGGDPVVLVHGFTIPYFIWDPTFSALVDAGYRVLRYDLFGRGFSDRPRKKYDLSLFVRQLSDLLDALEIPRASIIGLSMGGAISTGFAVQFPAHVRKLILIDPIGTQPMPLSLLYRAALLPAISELILGLVSAKKLADGLGSDFYDPRLLERFRTQYLEQARYKGFKRAILSTLRNKSLNGFPGLYADLGKTNVPVLLIWGRDDQTLPLAQSESIIKLVPRLEFRVVEDCGHVPNYERPEIVNPLLTQCLASK